jgi:hypothetical protein
MDLWQIIIIPLASALLGIIPLGFYRHSLNRREMARLRRALDCAADFRQLARDVGVEDSDVRKDFDTVEMRYQKLLQEYEKLNGMLLRR